MRAGVRGHYGRAVVLVLAARAWRWALRIRSWPCGNYIWRFFCRLTDPVVALVSLATPRAAAPVVLWLFGVVWLFWLRVGLLYLFLVLGAVPRIN